LKNYRRDVLANLKSVLVLDDVKRSEEEKNLEAVASVPTKTATIKVSLASISCSSNVEIDFSLFNLATAGFVFFFPSSFIHNTYSLPNNDDNRRAFQLRFHYPPTNQTLVTHPFPLWTTNWTLEEDLTLNLNIAENLLSELKSKSRSVFSFALFRVLIVEKKKTNE
jgi:hypothetical protein